MQIFTGMILSYLCMSLCFSRGYKCQQDECIPVFPTLPSYIKCSNNWTWAHVHMKISERESVRAMGGGEKVQ
jgi:hypothetical protein